jgi:hypothetical protein
MTFENKEQEDEFKKADKLKLRIPLHKLYFIILYIFFLIIAYIA